MSDASARIAAMRDEYVEGPRLNRTQQGMRAVGAQDAVDEAARAVNRLLDKGVITRDHQHELLWPLRIAFLALNDVLAETSVFVEHPERMFRRKPLEW